MNFGKARISRSGLHNAQRYAFSVSQNDLIAFFDLAEILHSRVDLEGSHVPGGNPHVNHALPGIDRLYGARQLYRPGHHAPRFLTLWR